MRRLDDELAGIADEMQGMRDEFHWYRTIERPSLPNATSMRCLPHVRGEPRPWTPLA